MERDWLISKNMCIKVCLTSGSYQNPGLPLYRDLKLLPCLVMLTVYFGLVNKTEFSQQPADTTEYPVSDVVVKKKWMKLSEIKMCALRKPEPLQFAEYISQGSCRCLYWAF